MSHIEMRETGISFCRIDSDLSDNLKEDVKDKDEEKDKDFAEKLEKSLKTA